MMKYELALSVNNQAMRLMVEPHLTLLDVLRDELGLTGAKEGCGTGDCGACTILLDGAPVNACLVLALEAEGREVITVEGLAAYSGLPEGSLHPVQKAFIEQGALQCGYCTPGMILSSVDLLARNPRPSAGEIRDALAGNLCRCTGYDKIVQAVQAAANLPAVQPDPSQTATAGGADHD